MTPHYKAPLAEARKARRAELREQLELAVTLARKLEGAISQAFPRAAQACREGAVPNLGEMSVDERLALGEKAVCELKAIAFVVSPEIAIDCLEAELPSDESSRAEATALMRQLRAMPK